MLEIAPTTYWSAKTRKPCARKVRDAEMGPKVRAIWKKNYSVYGRRKMAVAVRKAGIDIGRDQVARLMKAEGISGQSSEEAFHHPRRSGRDPGPGSGETELHRDRTRSVVGCGFHVLLDMVWDRVRGVCCRRVLPAHRRLESSAHHARRPRRGCAEHGRLDPAGHRPRRADLPQRRRLPGQYTSITYTDRIDEIGATPSIGTIGDSFDNAMAESVNALYKTELHRNPAVLAANGGHWKGLEDLELATCGWVSWFNEDRIHGELDDRSQAEVEAAHCRSRGQADAA